MASAASVRLQKPHFAAPVARPLSAGQLQQRQKNGGKLFWRPTAKRGLRSCLHCGIIQEDKTFRINGCKNDCFDATQAKLHLDLHTTKNYSGIISITEPFDPETGIPRKSWVARYHRIHGVCGCYSLHRVGDRPRLVHGEWEFHGREQVPEEWQIDKMNGVKKSRGNNFMRRNNAADQVKAAQQAQQDETMYAEAPKNVAEEEEPVAPEETPLEMPRRKRKSKKGTGEDDWSDLGDMDMDFTLEDGEAEALEEATETVEEEESKDVTQTATGTEDVNEEDFFL